MEMRARVTGYENGIRGLLRCNRHVGAVEGETGKLLLVRLREVRVLNNAVERSFCSKDSIEVRHILQK